MMKKHSLLKPFSIIFTAVILLSMLIPGRISGWSAVTINRTHADIANAAYNIISADPAFKNIKFPDLKTIQDNDLVNVNRTGTGPDVIGFSNASAHFYNPRLEAQNKKAGGAPDAVKDEFTKLVTAFSGGNPTGAAHAASWLAHYMSDISMPYHTQGAYRSDIMSIYAAAGGDNAAAVPLPSYITGPMNLSTTIFDHPNDFKKEIRAFRDATANHTATEDWFDPWYWDGTINAMLTSSHVVFEGETFDMPGAWWAPATPAVDKYSKLWDNTEPSFDNTAAKQAEKIREFARQESGIAQRTTDGVNGLVSSAVPYLRSSIEDAATVWRASFTGLTPSLTFSIPDKNEPQRFKLQGVVGNAAGADVYDVKLKLTLTGGTVKSGESMPTIGWIEKGTGKIYTWEIEAAKLGYCTAKVEVIGKYNDTPDLQYAITQATAPGIIPVTSSTSGARDHSIVFCLDNSGSMQGQPIIDAMNAGVQAVNAAQFATTEMALYFFGQNGCDAPIRVVDFTLNRDKIKNAINTAAARGNTPLAVAISTAGAYIKSNAQGQAATIILLTDGMETCNGDPVAAARALNPSLKLKTSFLVKPVYAANDIPIKLQVVGFNITSAATETKLKEIALAGNGAYYPATGVQQLVQALNQAIKEGTGGGFQFQTWWFIAAGAVLLLTIIISIARRGKHTPVPAPAAVTPGVLNTAPPQTAPRPAVNAPPQGSFCPNCGTRVQAGAVFCTGCGKPLAPQTPAFCPRCGTAVTAGSVFCSKCGTALTANAPAYTAQPAQPSITPTQVAAPQPAAKKAWGGWWLIAILLLLPGGLIAWAATRRNNPKTASAMLMVSMLATALVFYSIVQNILN